MGGFADGIIRVTTMQAGLATPTLWSSAPQGGESSCNKAGSEILNHHLCCLRRHGKLSLCLGACPQTGKVMHTTAGEHGHPAFIFYRGR